ncbi:MAG: hypothetical protein LBQ15_09710 [Clostridium sp.]|jgi:hypothetical protein|nr:hypothetical protein [Clostridium sp.]
MHPAPESLPGVEEKPVRKDKLPQRQGREVPRYVNLSLRKAVYDREGGVIEEPKDIHALPMPLTLTAGRPALGRAAFRLHRRVSRSPDDREATG